MGNQRMRLTALIVVAGALAVFPSTAAASTTATPTALDFGSQQVGATSAPQTVTISTLCTSYFGTPINLCLIQGAFLPSPSISGDFVQTNDCGGGISSTSPTTPSLCTFSVSFEPTGTGLRSGTLTTGSDLFGSSPSAITLSGTGLANPRSGSGSGPGSTGSTTRKKKCKKKKKKKPRSAQIAKKRCKKKRR
jgi:hypothetical protein